jgi:hypothetical protein
MAVGTALAIGGGLGALGGLVGGLTGKTTNSTVNVQGPGAFENEATNIEQQQLRDLNGLVSQGPGASDVAASLSSQRSLSQMLQQYAQSGGLPSTADISATNGLASNLFAARRTSLNQNFEDQNVASNQLAARLGRTQDDPILRAKLLTNQSRMVDSLNAEQQGVGTQLAMGLADRRVGYAQGAASVDAALAAQAQQNRAALLGLGSSVATRNSNFRLATAGRTNETPGSVGGAIGGALGGLGSGMAAGQAFGNMFAASVPVGGYGGGGGLNFSQPLRGQIGLNSFDTPTFGQSAASGRNFSLGGSY